MSVKVGDRVKVEFEAIYRGDRGINNNGRALVELLDRGDEYYATIPGDARIEVLPEPVKVGDKVSTVDQYESLPEKSIVARDGFDPVTKIRGEWHGYDDSVYTNYRWATGGPAAVVLRVGGDS